MAERIDRDELRALIREALKEALSIPPPTTESPPPLRREGVAPSPEGSRVGDQREASRNPSPSPSPQGGGGRASSPRNGAFRFESGLLNESKVAELGRTHTKIIIGSDVAVTPLARDRAREIKVEIVRQKP